MKRTMKKCMVWLLTMVIVFGMTACSSSNEKEEKGGDDTLEIGVVLMDFNTEFSIGLKDYMEAKAEEMGNVKLNIVDSQGDAAKQVQQVESFIGQKVDAIILQPQEQEASSPCVDKAKEAGIPIVNVNSLTTAEPDAYVGSDDAESAKIAMNYIAEQLDGKGNVVMMHGHAGQTAEVKRTEGAVEVIENYPELNMLDEQTADWSRADAMTLMENWLQAHGDQINAVFCQNDEMALGALNALIQNNKKDNILVVGVDAIADALQSVKDGKMDATVYQDCKGQAEGALETAVKLVNGEKVESETMIPFILVTEENVDEYLN